MEEDVLKIEGTVLVRCLDKNVESVTIPNYVTKIDIKAFRRCASLKSIVIPPSVTEIDDYAFFNCTSLSSVIIPESVTSIGEGAFFNCTSLSSVIIPESVTKIGSYAFCHCNITALSHPCLTIKDGLAIEYDDWVVYCATQSRSITIPDGIRVIFDRAFCDCASIESVKIPESVTTISNKAFKGCNITELSHPLLTIKNGVAIENNKVLYWTNQSSSITIPDGVREIEYYAFYDNKTLSSVVIPPSVKEIGKEAFEGCSSLSSVVIPDSVRKIGDKAFMGCDIDELSHPCLKIKNGFAIKGKKVLYRTTQSDSFIIPNGVKEIVEDVLDGYSEPESVEFSGTVAQWEAIVGKWYLLKHISEKSVKCSDGVWQLPVLLIENGSLKQCTDKSATSVTIPDGVTEIAHNAFSGCESLKSLEIPSGVTKIGAYSFCESLSSISLPSSITEFDKEAFFFVGKSLSKVILADDFQKVPSEWFDRLDWNNENYEIVCTKDSSTYKAVKRSPKLKKHLKDVALQVAKNEKIATVNKIGADALLSTLRSSVEGFSFQILATTKSATVVLVQIGKNVGVFKLGADSSKWFSKLQKVLEAFSDSTKSGEEIFDVITRVKLPLGEIPGKKAEKMTLRGDNMNLFASGVLREIEYCVLKGSALFGIKEIGYRAFKSGCDYSLSSVKIPKSVTKIGSEAFRGCSKLESIEIPDSVTEIGEKAFKSSSLASVVIPDSVTKIGDKAFEYTDINELSHPLLTIKNGIAIKDGTVLYSANYTSKITLPDGVTKIGEKAFYECSGLYSMVLPESLKEIDDNAFFECDSLETLEFKGTVAQWKAVKKCVDLCFRIGTRTVKCTDGEAKL
ncbi:MAG: leucine-rich repeat domain-containing protein [Treponema sp.]|nr:leucine-rich repeat domain-containing protein [Treponema sp.]